MRDFYLIFSVGTSSGEKKIKNKQKNRGTSLEQETIQFEMAADNLINQFKSIGLSEAKAKDTVKNANLSKNLEESIVEAKKYTGDISSSQGMLLYHVSSKIKPQVRHHLPFLSKYVAENKLNTELRVNTALDFLLQNAKDKTVDTKGLFV